MTDDIYEAAKNPDNPEGVARLSELARPILGQQANTIQSLNRALSQLTRTALVMIGLVVSGLTLTKSGAGIEFTTIKLGLLFFSTAFLLLGALLGLFTRNYAHGIGASDKLYRDAIEDGYSKSEVNGRISLISGSHISKNSAAIRVLMNRIQFVQLFVGIGTALLSFTVVLFLFPKTPEAVLFVFFEILGVSAILYRWNRDLKKKRENMERAEFPEFH
ncbi:hypothetical protein [Halobacterium litoreum]|uniref:Uncharacterized protein n=1 Tax=Halobacterium litoreum TaxID=2039234 RepID=A0ABD5NAT9_9EURY|nr:hypothetical protein [Halobacterium litoreum]UHH11993.1 hypothetical protein LT972_07460 [Halobacterium litoreum]